MDEGSPRSEVLLRSKLYQDKPGYARLLLMPLVLLQQACDAAFDWIGARISGELLGREERSPLEHLAAFAVVTLVSWAAYRGRDYMDWVLLALILAWRGDEMLAWGEFTGGDNHREVTLSLWEDGRLESRLSGALGPTWLPPGEARQVYLRRLHLQTGWLKRRVATAWRVSIADNSGGEVPVYEDLSAAAALTQARKLGQRLDLPVKVAASRGLGPLAEQTLRGEAPAEEAIESKEDAYGLRLNIGWTRGSLTVFLGQAVKESGLLLFIICVSRLMTAFGALLTGLILPWFGLISGSDIMLTLDFSDFVPLLDPTSSPLDLAELALALAIIAHGLWWLGRSKSLLISKDRTRFMIGGELVSSLATERLEPPLYLAQPEPVILLTDGTSVIEVSDLPTPTAFSSLLYRLENRPKI